MGIEIKPVGVACNLRCTYCYQNDQRDLGDGLNSNDAKLLRSIEQLRGPVAIFGGEPLLVPLGRLEAMFSSLLATRGGCTIQTNGTLLSGEHIALFRRYAVSVGVSVDGPGVLNANRPSTSGTDGCETASASIRALELLRQGGIPHSVIITLTAANCSSDARPSLLQWIDSLVEGGCSSLRLHLLEVEPSADRDKIQPTRAELLATLDSLYAYERARGANVFDLFSEMRNLLSGDDRTASCVWHACDPYHTAAVTGVENDGSITNCGRTLDSGVNFLKSETQNFARYVALHSVPVADGGCGGCPFFLACKGYCPGTAERKDWRNKTEHCATLTHLFERIEIDMLADALKPISRSPWRRDLENLALKAWRQGQRFSLSEIDLRQRTVSW